MTGSGVMTIFVYKGLTGTAEIRNTPSLFCPISGDWGKLGIPNLARMSVIKNVILNAVKCHSYSFCRF